jgi:uncharacterized membrane protein
MKKITQKKFKRGQGSLQKKPVTKKIPHKKSSPKKQDETTFKGLMESPKKKFGLRNVLQAIIGATLLAIPIGLTEETWKLGETLPLWNIFIILLVSLLFITLFAYRNLRKNTSNFVWHELTKRVFINYLISFIVVAILLTVIQKTPWGTDFILSFKRTIIVTFPASLSATIAGSLK